MRITVKVPDTSRCRVSRPGVVVQLSRVCWGNFSDGKIGQGLRVGSSTGTRKESYEPRLAPLKNSSASSRAAGAQGGLLYGFSPDGFNRSGCGNQTRQGRFAREDCSAAA